VERETPDAADAEAQTDLVGGLVEAEVPTGSAHLLDELSNYLTSRKLLLLKESIEGSLAHGTPKEALEAVQNFRTVSPAESVGYIPTLGKAALRRAFAEPDESLIKFPKSAAWFFGDAFCRDSLIGIQAPEKTGKTWWCLYLMLLAVSNFQRVALFQTGDLTERQLTLRWAQYIAGVPRKWHECQSGVRIPTSLKITDGKPEVQFRAQKFPQPLDLHSANAARRQFNRDFKVDTKRPTLMFSVHANSTINVRGIDGILKRWRHEQGFTPDVILIDYADILAPENPREEFRHQVNTTWKALRRLSQDWHACVVAPTQAAARAYKKKTQSMGDFSENKAKNAHVTGMLGLNQTPTEKEQQVMRLNWLALREAEFHSNRPLWVANCLALGRAMVLATKG
jgi:hypothetical protein